MRCLLILLLCVRVCSHTTYVLGDLHGDLYYTLANLHHLRLIDVDGHWTGGSNILVQMGDVVDRGDDSRFIIDLFELLRIEAEEQGGRVFNMLGNHEHLTIAGILAYVAENDVRTFGDMPTRITAFSKEGKYGQLIRSYYPVLVLNSSVFVHAGISPFWAQRGVAELNTRILAALDDGNGDEVIAEEGPLWNRRVIFSAMRGECSLVQQSLNTLSKTEGEPIHRMIVGHTIQEQGEISYYCEGRLIATDVAISRWCGGGRMGAIAIQMDDSNRLVVNRVIPPGTEPGEDIDVIHQNVCSRLMQHDNITGEDNTGNCLLGRQANIAEAMQQLMMNQARGRLAGGGKLTGQQRAQRQRQIGLQRQRILAAKRNGIRPQRTTVQRGIGLQQSNMARPQQQGQQQQQRPKEEGGIQQQETAQESLLRDLTEFATRGGGGNVEENAHIANVQQPQDTNNNNNFAKLQEIDEKRRQLKIQNNLAPNNVAQVEQELAKTKVHTEVQTNLQLEESGNRPPILLWAVFLLIGLFGYKYYCRRCQPKTWM